MHILPKPAGAFRPNISKATWRRPALLGLALLVAVALLPQGRAVGARARGRIEGVVTFEGRPVRKALVVASSARMGERTGLANEYGFFSIDDLNDGAYVVTVSHPVYVAGDGSDASGGHRLVEVRDGGRVELNFSLSAGGVIKGRVRDAAGQPVVAQLVSYERDEAGPAFSPMLFRPAVLTDDQGRFRIYGLPVGRYRVAVGKPSGDIGKPTSPFSPTYFPGGASPAAAISLGAGQELDLGEMELRAAQRAFSAEIHFVEAERGEALPGFEFDLLRLGEGGAVVRTAFKADALGVARVENLQPGRYRIMPAVKNNGAQGAGGFSPVPFDIADRSVGPLTVKCDSALASVAGEVRIGERAPATELDCAVALREGDDLAAQDRPVYRVRLDREGRFRVTGLRRTVYTLVVLPLRPSLQFESATVDGRLLAEPNIVGVLRLDLGTDATGTVSINLSDSRH